LTPFSRIDRFVDHRIEVFSTLQLKNEKAATGYESAAAFFVSRFSSRDRCFW